MRYGFGPSETCQACAQRAAQSFCNLSPAALATLDRVSFTHAYPAGSILFSEGQPASGLFMICRGSAKVSMGSGDGKTLIIHLAHVGEPLGLASVVTGHDHQTTAETVEPTQIRFVPRDDFLRIVAEHHEVLARTCEHLSIECEADNDQLRAIGLSHSAAEKLARLFLGWSTEHGTRGDDGLRVPMLMTHHDIAELIGTSRETVTRLLREFRDRKVIEIKGSTLIIHDQTALESLVASGQAS